MTNSSSVLHQQAGLNWHRSDGVIQAGKQSCLREICQRLPMRKRRQTTFSFSENQKRDRFTFLNTGQTTVSFARKTMVWTGPDCLAFHLKTHSVKICLSLSEKTDPCEFQVSRRLCSSWWAVFAARPRSRPCTYSATESTPRNRKQS